MKRLPFVTAALVVVASAAVAVGLAIDPRPFSEGPAAVLAAGLVTFGLICSVGLLLSRGRWARYASLGTSAGVLAIVVAAGFDPAGVVAVGAGAGGIAILSGPWLDGWLRKRPAALGPGPAAVILLLGTLALVPATAISSPDALDWQQAVMVGAALLVAYAYSRRSIAALWALRLGLLPISIMAIAAAPVVGGIYLAAHVAALSGLAWTDDATIAARPLLDRHYGPRSARPPAGERPPSEAGR